MKLERHTVVDKNGNPTGVESYWFWCPGCGCHHRYETPQWTFNGNMECPTFTPSLLWIGHCHMFLTDGKIHFLSDCNHQLAGQVVDLPDIPNDN